MRTLSKDILMICKVWYNRQSYKKIQDALFAYIKHYTWCGPDIATINHFLGHAVKKFIDTNSLINTLREHSESFLHRDEDVKLFLLNTYVSLLQLKEAINIDLSDYDKIEDYVKNESNTEDWWDVFGSPEDDRN